VRDTFSRAIAAHRHLLLMAAWMIRIRVRSSVIVLLRSAASIATLYRVFVLYSHVAFVSCARVLDTIASPASAASSH
jgi:hypothetical protein